MVSLINNAFMRLQLRSENVDSTKLLATFVDVGPLFTLLSTPDHQVLYGRRGTGKTHALRYLAETRQQKGDLAVYVDMRKLGSSGGIYADSGIPVAERATRLLVDTLTTIHDYLYEYFVTWDEQYDLSRTGPILDGFAEAITEVAVSGQVEKETISSDTSSSSNSADTRLEMNGQGFNVSLGSSSAKSHQDQLQSRVTETGVVRHRVHFGSVSKAFEDITDIISPKRVWLLLDEWSSVPIDLQPYLADLLRRAVFPLRGITVKIGAIEFRSLFKYKGERGDYIGIELGADASANLDLDDFMAFDNDAEKAKQFFQELLFRHFKEIEELDLSSVPKSSTELIQQGFTQQNAFEEFVKATEGVPRDAINIITGAAQKALDEKISINHIRTAARNWYLRDKEASVRSSPQAHNLLLWIIDEVIGDRKARAFLIQSNISHELIDTLFDARVLHIRKRNISAKDQPGVRYDAYKLDYGCYVDLINTARAPLGSYLTETDTGEETYVEVPSDDYRVIRRAILDLDRFMEAQGNSSSG